MDILEFRQLLIEQNQLITELRLNDKRINTKNTAKPYKEQLILRNKQIEERLIDLIRLARGNG